MSSTWFNEHQEMYLCVWVYIHILGRYVCNNSGYNQSDIPEQSFRFMLRFTWIIRANKIYNIHLILQTTF